MIILANWKAYVETADQAKTLFAAAKRLASRTKTRIVLAPPSPLLGMLAPGNKSSVSFCAQDVSQTLGGAYTGETTAQLCAQMGASYALVGHSERRALGDSQAVVAEKLGHAVAQGLTPVLCVGERERDASGAYLGFIREQLTSALEPLSPKERSAVLVAYEPLWAIGKSAAESITPLDLSEMILYIRKVLAELLPGKSAGRTKVLYGGAVEAENIRGLAGAASVDGFLVGHASVDAKTFSALIRALS